MREILGPDPWYFIWSLASGVALGLLYDIFRLQRKIIRTPDVAVNIEDIIFIILGGGVATALAYWINNGFFRIYSLISMVVGFCVYRLIIGSRIVNLLMCVYMALCKGVCFIFKILLIPVRTAARIMGKTIFVTLKGGRILKKLKAVTKREKSEIKSV